MKNERGFSIVELMVGLVISMVVSLAVFQTFGAFEAQKRTTTTGTDTQANGLVALQNLERDLKMAGDGLSNDWLQSCTNVFHTYNGAPIPNFSLAAVSIIDGGAGSDQIIVRRGTSVRSNGALGLAIPMSSVSAPLEVTNTLGFFAGDIAVIADKPPGGTNCSLFQVNNVNEFAGGGGAAQLIHNAGLFNAPGAGWPVHDANAQIFNLGNLVQRTYSVVANALQTQDFPAAAGVAVASEIVQLQAQYGIDADNNESIDAGGWVNATGVWAAPGPAQFRQIKAVRLAIVARGALQEKVNASSVCDATPTTVWPSSGLPAWGSATMLDVSAIPNWRCYRYRVYETTVPLRNVIWGNVSNINVKQ